MKRLITCLVIAFGALASPAGAQDSMQGHGAQGFRGQGVRSAPQREFAWTPEVIDAFAAVPLQSEGRVKPIENFAGYLMLRINGRRSLKTPDGESLGPIEWMLDLLFFPEQSRDYKVFLVEDGEILDAIGLEVDGKKRRDRYSFNELRPGGQELLRLAQKYSKIKSKSRLQNHIVRLASNINEYATFDRYMLFAGNSARVGNNSPELREMFGEAERIKFSDALPMAGRLLQTYRKLSAELGEDHERVKALDRAMDVLSIGGGGQHFTLFAPTVSLEQREEWYSINQLISDSARGGRTHKPHIEQLVRLEAMFAQRTNPDRFTGLMDKFSAAAIAAAEKRGEYGSVAMEQFYLRAQPFFWAMVFFIISLVVVSLSWLRPGAKWPYRIGIVAVLIPLGFTVWGVTLRCMIRDLPPVTGIWDTIPYITSGAVIAALLMEWINKKRIALPVAAMLGTFGLILAHNHETMVGQDTMRMLDAVLLSNYWLIVHVLSINLGYAAPLLAAAFAHVYVLGKVFGWKKSDPAFYKNIGRMVYGALAFGLVFSVVGTILGGVWANDSWGRFWGWDPKENGALMICLWLAAMLHARMGGYLRDFGICVATIFGATIVAFSWFHTNMLGIGLHSYGATEGRDALYTFYYIEWGMTGLGGFFAFRARNARLEDEARRREAVAAKREAVAEGDVATT